MNCSCHPRRARAPTGRGGRHHHGRRPAGCSRGRHGRQTELPFGGRGGRRAVAGRKPKGARPLVSHLRRPGLDGRSPVHVTMSIDRKVGRLRLRPRFAALRQALGAGAERFGLRLVHYSVQDYHLHLLCEATDRRALGRGVQGLAVRLARALNRLLGRHGKVFADRYHARVLGTPRQVRSALLYVLSNHQRHAAQRGGRVRPLGTDPFSSGPYFDGWSQPVRLGANWDPGGPVGVQPRTWLLRVGWRRAGGLIEPWAVPGSA